MKITDIRFGMLRVPLKTPFKEDGRVTAATSQSPSTSFFTWWSLPRISRAAR